MTDLMLSYLMLPYPLDITMNQLIHRKDTTWVESLRGTKGAYQQRVAAEMLATYLYTLIFHYLVHHLSQNNRAFPLITQSSTVALERVAQEMVQQCLINLHSEGYMMLDTYPQIGSLSGWLAQQILRQASYELTVRL